VNVLALIPARSGSKGIPHKNIASFHGKPLLAHSIEQARAARTVTRTIVSTDSELYASIARQYGAETPFLRPAEFSADLSSDLVTFQHALGWLRDNEGYVPDICVHLRPTYPTRRVEDIDRAVELLRSDPSFDSVRSVTATDATPFKMWFRGPDDGLTPVVTLPDVAEAHSQPRQMLPQVFWQNACVDAVWSRVISQKGSMCGERVRGLVMDHFHDIDTTSELEAAQGSAGPAKLTGKRFVVDIDGVIASLAPQNEYALAEPLTDAIAVVNRLYELGNTIILFTARGSLTGRDWAATTREQMERWGVRYHELRFGKPHADYYIDDRLVTLSAVQAMLARMPH
jgi:CMP-N,N'-diacetyllegionaminic acid synthase